MTPTDSWPAALTRVIARQVRRYRKQRGMSADQLANAVNDLGGMPYSRAQVTNLEAGRRDTITVGEVFAFAKVFDCPPALLLAPLDEDSVPLLPGVEAEPWAAYKWVTGESSFVLGEVQLGGAVRLSAYRNHDEALLRYWIRRESGSDDQDAYLDALAQARANLHGQGWRLPTLPPAIASTVEAREKELLR